jgi:hypothetical protein
MSKTFFKSQMILCEEFRSRNKDRRRLSRSLFKHIEFTLDHRIINHQSNHENQLNQTEHE